MQALLVVMRRVVAEVARHEVVERIQRVVRSAEVVIGIQSGVVVIGRPRRDQQPRDHRQAEHYEALQRLQHNQIDAILCDLEMPGRNVFDFLKVRQRMPKVNLIPKIMLTSRAGAKHKSLAKDLGATDYLNKPYLAPQLLAKLSAALESLAEA